jgi:hypothetical protein
VTPPRDATVHGQFGDLGVGGAGRMPGGAAVIPDPLDPLTPGSPMVM